MLPPFGVGARSTRAGSFSVGRERVLAIMASAGHVSISLFHYLHNMYFNTCAQNDGYTVPKTMVTVPRMLVERMAVPGLCAWEAFYRTRGHIGNCDTTSALDVSNGLAGKICPLERLDPEYWVSWQRTA
jgi:hypothetical protein